MGRDVEKLDEKPQEVSFNPHAPMGRDFMLPRTIPSSPSFNPHAPMGRDNIFHFHFIASYSFNPHAPMGRDAMNAIIASYTAMFQSTRPYGARQNGIKKNYERSYVSIHTPLWGATRCGPCILYDGKVSIHTPLWGATITSCSLLKSP